MKINSQQTIFYGIENTIKKYRKFAQYNIYQEVSDITLDQILILSILDSEPDISQKDIALILFKDYASVTRMIELLVQKEYLERQIHKQDRRMFNLQITHKGNETLTKLKPIILKNRSQALKGLSDKQIEQFTNTLNQITKNCAIQE